MHHRWKLRVLLIVLIGLMSAVAVTAILVNARGTLTNLRTVDFLGRANQLAEETLRANNRIAMERGVTAVIIAAPDEAPAGLLSEMANLRRQNGEFHPHILEQAGILAATAPREGMQQQLAATDNAWQRLQTVRQQVDHLLTNATDTPARHQLQGHWMEASTAYIEAISRLRQNILEPRQETDHALHLNLFAKEVFFTASEFAGRERALLGTVIAERRHLTTGEKMQLLRYRSIVEEALHKIHSLLQTFPPTPEITQGQRQLEAVFLGEYETLRQQVYAAGIRDADYPLDAADWYRQATRGINSLLDLSAAVAMHISDDVDHIGATARNTVITLGVALVLTLALVLLIVRVIYRRGYQPLRLLESAAHTIAAGDLNQPVVLPYGDELGDVAFAFERMRVNLLADMARREVDETERRKLWQAIEQSVSGIMITDPNGRIEYVNPSFELTSGYKARELIGRNPDMLKSGETPRHVYQELWSTLKAGRIWTGELQNRNKQGEIYWVHNAISPVRDKVGAITHYVSIQHDITAQKQMLDQLHHISHYDQLTLLPNRSLLADRFDQAEAHARRNDYGMAILSLDLDRFKLINEGLGHQMGDAALRAIANRLREQVRGGDTVARYTADQFVILLPDLTTPLAVSDYAVRVREALAQPLILGEHELRLSCSMGAALYPQDGTDLATLLHNAEAARHHAKTDGEPFRFFTQALNENAAERLQLENDLRGALEREEFELHYQPQVDAVSGRITSLEALVRWRHPQRGLIPPLKFIPLTEETGLILPLGEWVLRTACHQAAAWRADGMGDVIVSVNLSARQLRQSELPETIRTVLTETGLPPHLLELELTESMVMHNPDATLELLRQCKQSGVLLALDDFGTGYSSLAYLRRFPFDKLKIDRSFVQNITTDPDEAAIALSIIALARNLRLHTTAEGVETEAQACYLRRHGCGLLQGYLISRPLPGNEMAQFLRASPQLAFAPCQNGDHTPKLLLVDDEQHILNALQRSLRSSQFPILTATDPMEAFNLLATHEIGVVVCDQRMPHMLGTEFLARLKMLYPETARILLTGNTDTETAQRAVNEGHVFRFFTKPWDDTELLRAIEMGMQDYRERQTAAGRG